MCGGGVGWRAVVYLLGLFFILLGLSMLMARDLHWRLHAWGKRTEGVVQVERTPEWDTMQTFSGTLMILFGFVVLAVGCRVGESNERPRREPGGVEFKSYQDLPPEVRKIMDEWQPATKPSGR